MIIPTIISITLIAMTGILYRSGQRLTPIIGGVAALLLSSYVLIAITTVGTQQKMKVLLKITHSRGTAEQSGIKNGMLFLGYDDVIFRTDQEQHAHQDLMQFISFVRSNPDKQVSIHLQNSSGHTYRKSITISKASDGIGIATFGGTITSVPDGNKVIHRSPLEAVQEGISRTHKWILNSAAAIINILQAKLWFRNIGGPLAAFGYLYQATSQNWRSLALTISRLQTGIIALCILPLWPLPGFVIVKGLICMAGASASVVHAVQVASALGLAAFLGIWSYHDLARNLGW